jgi:hypothetical protein
MAICEAFLCILADWCLVPREGPPRLLNAFSGREKGREHGAATEECFSRLYSGR